MNIELWRDETLDAIPEGCDAALTVRDLQRKLGLPDVTIVRHRLHALIKAGEPIAQSDRGYFRVRKGDRNDLAQMKRSINNMRSNGYALLDKARNLENTLNRIELNR